MSNLLQHLKSDASALEEWLDKTLTSDTRSGEIYRPQMLLESMRHATLNGGKRFRPFLVLQTGALFNADRSNLLQVAAALECLHCYSLVHDDLPAMDDDDLRRGQPTVHRAFDEATAILAGDALLTYAFDLVSDPIAHPDANIRIALISKLAKAAGLGGMAGGQMLDLSPESKSPSQPEIARMQSMKTGALIKFACEAGGLCGGASATEQQTLSVFGAKIGQAFQLADDILDATATSDQLGKQTGKDDAQGKQTQVSTMGIEAARKMANELVSDACEAIDQFGQKADVLKQVAVFTLERQQ